MPPWAVQVERLLEEQAKLQTKLTESQEENTKLLRHTNANAKIQYVNKMKEDYNRMVKVSVQRAGRMRCR